MKRFFLWLILLLAPLAAQATGQCYASGTTDQVTFFVAVDATDFTTRETGLTTFTVYRARDVGAATIFTTPTVAELSAANMPGVYSLLLDEDMTIGTGNVFEEMSLHVTHAGMAPVTKTICIIDLADSTDLQADVQAVIETNSLDHWGAQAVVGTDIVDNSYVARQLSKSATADFDSYDNQTDSQEAIRDLLTVTDTKVSTAQLDLDLATDGIISGAAATGTLSTTQATSDLTGFGDFQLIGRVIIWLTGDAAGEAATITDYAETGGLLTFSTLTTAPADGDTFKII